MKGISAAIIAVMNDVEGVAKNMTVGSGSNSYKGVSDKDVRQKMRESMTKNGLSILPISITPSIRMDRWEEADSYNKGAMKTKQSVFTEVVTKYMLLHVSGESIELCGYGQGVDTQDKGAGKATTYALKNTLLNMFLVPTGVDTDDTHSDELPVPQKRSEYDQTDDKPWMNEPQFDQLEANMHLYEDAESAVKAAAKKYKVSKQMRAKIEALYQ